MVTKEGERMIEYFKRQNEKKNHESQVKQETIDLTSHESQVKQETIDLTSHESQVKQETIDTGEQSSEIVDAMSQKELLASLDQLNSEFIEFEKIREGIRSKIVAIADILPQFNEQRSLLQKDVDEKQKEFEQLDIRIPALAQQEEVLLQSIETRKKEKVRLDDEIRLEQDKVKEVKGLVSKLSRERKKVKNNIKQKLDEIKKIDEQITQIKSVQDYGVDLVSTLVYTSEKR